MALLEGRNGDHIVAGSQALWTLGQ
jgi:hypothetical protein